MQIRRVILLSATLFCALQLPACEVFDGPTLTAGEKVCTAGTKIECDHLFAIAAELQTPEMERRIAEARR